jgi:serine/threonine protein kinase
MATSSGLPERYKVLQELESSASTVIYKAEDSHPRYKGSLVTIEMLRPNLSNSNKRLKELKLAVSERENLKSVHFAKILDWNTTQEPYYLVFEHTDGISLAQLLQKRPHSLSPKEAFTIALVVLEALKVAHRNHYFALEIKPTNIILDNKGGVRLINLKITRPVTTAKVSLQDQACYTSPEQALALPVDAPSNLYCVGVVLYEMLSGKLPFYADSSYDLLLLHASPEPAPPLENVTAKVNQIVQTALSKAPAERYQSAAPMMDDLNRYLDQNGGRADLKALLAPPPPLKPIALPPTPNSQTAIPHPPKLNAETTIVAPHPEPKIVPAKPEPTSSRSNSKWLVLIGLLLLGLLIGLVAFFSFPGGNPPTPTRIIAATATIIPATVTAAPTTVAQSTATATVRPTATSSPLPTLAPAQRLFNETNVRFTEKKWAEAVAGYLKLLADYPSFEPAQVRERLAGAYFELKDYEKALELYLFLEANFSNYRSNEVKSSLAETYCTFGKAIARIVEVDKVISILTQCFQRNPTNAEAKDLLDKEILYKEGREAGRAQNWILALEKLRLLYALEQKFRDADGIMFDAFMQYGQKLMGEGNFAQAAKIYEEASQMTANPPLVRPEEAAQKQNEANNRLIPTATPLLVQPRPNPTPTPTIRVVIPLPVPTSTPTPYIPPPPPTNTPTPEGKLVEATRRP